MKSFEFDVDDAKDLLNAESDFNESLEARMEPVPRMQYLSDIIEYLEEKYPEKAPDLGDPDRMVWFKAGQRSIVRELIELQQEYKDEQERLTGTL